MRWRAGSALLCVLLGMLLGMVLLSAVFGPQAL